MNLKILGILAIAFLNGIVVWALERPSPDRVPDCIIDGRPAPVDNQQVLYWKKNTKNQFMARAYVRGVVSRDFGVKGDHNHFEIKLDTGKDDNLEVVYQNGFGPLPKLTVGMEVEACGDYITSYARGNGYPPSPSGALIHWVHERDRPGTHEHGFLVVGGKLYGVRKPRIQDATVDPDEWISPSVEPAFAW